MPDTSAYPYLQRVTSYIEQDPDSPIAAAFRRNIHCGYFTDDASPSAQRFAEASERLTRRIADAAGIADGQHILDVGCGYGGLLAHLNERLSGSVLVGIDIEPRPLALAKSLVAPANGNSV